LRHNILNLLSYNKKPSNSVHILNGHFVNSISSINDKNILDDLLIKLKKYFTLINFQEACELIDNKHIAKSPLLSFSFDDGFLDCYEFIAPVLEMHSINACYFINPKSIEIANEEERSFFIFKNLNINLDKQFMTWDQIKKLMDKGNCIGNHTYSHKILKNLTFEEAYEEINIGKQYLEDKLKFKNDYFAFPLGTPDYFDFNSINAAKKLHKTVFTSSFEYEKYFYQNDQQIISRRHFEGNWPVKHINYFTSKKRKFISFK
jgi:peptidoglycan/xylan/chitin deacetylase (PgdA/CDA1 family)